MSDAQKPLDLWKSEDVVTFLRGSPFESNKVESLSVRLANSVFRIFLNTPFDGQETLIVKQAKNFAAKLRPDSEDMITLSAERQKFEVGSLEFARQVVRPDALVTVPKVYHHYEENNVIIMEDCGTESRDLKALMLDDPLDPKQAEIVGEGLGEFLALIHREGSRNKDLMSIFGTHDEGKRITAWLTYGRLVETLKDEGVDKGLISPPIEISQRDLEDIGQIAKETSDAVFAAQKYFTMGDFWTGNIVVKRKRGQGGESIVDRVYVIDWEIAKPGLQYLDVGQILAELHLLEFFYREKTKSITEAINAFNRAYSRASDVDEAFARGVARHIGAHLVAWTARVGWEPKGRARKAVQEGVDYLVRSLSEDWLRQSIAGTLLS